MKLWAYFYFGLKSNTINCTKLTYSFRIPLRCNVLETFSNCYDDEHNVEDKPVQ